MLWRQSLRASVTGQQSPDLLRVAQTFFAYYAHVQTMASSSSTQGKTINGSYNGSEFSMAKYTSLSFFLIMPILFGG